MVDATTTSMSTPASNTMADMNVGIDMRQLGKPLDPEHLLSPVPRISPPAPAPSKRPSRPSTASAVEEQAAILPFDTKATLVGGQPDATSSFGMSALAGSILELGMEMDGNMVPSTDTGPEPTSIQGIGNSVNGGCGGIAVNRPTSSHAVIGEAEYDWAAFIGAYAAGRWDPHRTPKLPRAFVNNSLSGFFTSSSNPVTPFVPIPARKMGLPSTSLDVASLGQDSDFTRSAPSPAEPIGILDLNNREPSAPLASAAIPTYKVQSATPTLPSVEEVVTPPSTENLPAIVKYDQPQAALSSLPPNVRLPPPSINRTGPGKLSLPSFRARGSLDMRPSSAHPLTADSAALPSPSLASDTMTAAAAIRWAGSGVSLAPLALPSPERELTDPMRGVTATIPGSHPPETPGGTRLSRFWLGTQVVDDEGFIPTAEVSSPELGVSDASMESDSSKHTTPHQSTMPTPASGTAHTALTRSPPGSPRIRIGPGHARRRSTIPLASAPILHKSSESEDDYFGVGGDAGLVRAQLSSDSLDSQPPSSNLSMDLPSDFSPTTVPALPRRVNLTRQTSAPLPVFLQQQTGATNYRSESAASHRAGRAAKEEFMFTELGYLAPPFPPDELDRRRALFKFNIWNTGRDPNFDRIVHLAKLVFSTKIVCISMTDNNLEWFKAQAGFSESSWLRSVSLAAHAILQRGDEPMVILNTLEDWRFQKNPLVVGAPGIRFYAGAPLRTQDGFNIGILSIFDDQPRTEFSPRQRHTLKEFAAIAMRELELWRDKIQLRIRDRIQVSMEQFTRECLEIDNDNEKSKAVPTPGATMEQVYQRAARLVKRTLDVEGAIVLDVSHSDVLETIHAEGSVSVTMHRAEGINDSHDVALTADDFGKLSEFFSKYPDGKISESIMPSCLRAFMPRHIQYALTVPIQNIDGRPFALLCAFNASEHTKRYLEGHELSYLRAIGVIILSAVLKRRMILADQAKSLFISNISHELRTPLHGILAAAELLADSDLNHSQMSFLQTVQACGTSLVETVNHVLDFTKLSGNTKSGGIETSIHRSRVDLMQLVEEAVEGCWIGHQARMSALAESDIGSVYAPPSASSQPRLHVETVVDVSRRAGGWNVKCERGGIRRVLMNIFGNSLKFTSNGYIHVTLREAPGTSATPSGKIRLELSVLDTGKGISQDFLKNQLFHPFSQENPLQTGTGLGLAIVSSIVRSPSVDGTIDVSSTEGVGTEIRITFTAEIDGELESSYSDMEPLSFDDLIRTPTVSLIGFDKTHRGVDLFETVLSSNLSLWGIHVQSPSDSFGDIVILNESLTPVIDATRRRDPTRPFIILSQERGNSEIMSIVTEYERIGGFARIVFKPGGPSRIRSALKFCIHALKMAQRSRAPSLVESVSDTQVPRVKLEGHGVERAEIKNGAVGTHLLSRRNSEEKEIVAFLKRPGLGPRAFTMQTTTADWVSSGVNGDPSSDAESQDSSNHRRSSTQLVPIEQDDVSSPTVAIGSGGSILRSSMTTVSRTGPLRVLVVEDNKILRSLLIKWLKAKQYDYRDAVDGRDGVHTFETGGHFDVVLLDLSMPLLDGIGATAEIRAIEAARAAAAPDASRAARILALTGMSSLDDKRRAFEAGVDGYLVKPVAFKTLDEMLHQLGLN